MNGFGLDEAGIATLIDEVGISFDLNAALFDELDQQLASASR